MINNIKLNKVPGYETLRDEYFFDIDSQLIITKCTSRPKYIDWVVKGNRSQTSLITKNGPRKTVILSTILEGLKNVSDK